MDTDAETREPDVPRIKRYLPEIVKLAIERIPFEPRKYRFIKSAYADFTEALAFVLETTGDLPIDRATSAALYVGDQEITYLEKLGENQYRFLVFGERERLLEEGAPIFHGWPDTPEEKRKTEYYYKAPPPIDKAR